MIVFKFTLTHIKNTNFALVSSLASEVAELSAMLWLFILKSYKTYVRPMLPSGNRIWRLIYPDYYIYHRYQKSLNRLLKVCYVPATSAVLIAFFSSFLLRPFTVLMKQTRQPVRVIKQSYEESVVDKFKSNLLLMIFWFYMFNYNS